MFEAHEWILVGQTIYLILEQPPFWVRTNGTANLAGPRTFYDRPSSQLLAMFTLEETTTDMEIHGFL